MIELENAMKLLNSIPTLDADIEITLIKVEEQIDNAKIEIQKKDAKIRSLEDAYTSLTTINQSLTDEIGSLEHELDHSVSDCGNCYVVSALRADIEELKKTSIRF